MTTFTKKKGKGQDIFAFLTDVIPYWRVRPLAKCGAVQIKEVGSSTYVKEDVHYRIEEGDVVFIDSPLSTVCQTSIASISIKDSEFRDYAFVPGRSPPELAAKEFLKLRHPSTLFIYDDTTLSLSEFFSSLLNNIKLSHPIRDIILVAHANDTGIFLKLDPASSYPYADYESFEAAIKSKTFSSVPETILPRPNDTKAQSRLLIKGCNIGKSLDLLKVIKNALGGQMTVIAPKHGNEFYDISMIEGGIPGFIEWMYYQFDIFTPVQFIYRSQVIEAFRARKFTLLDGRTIVPKKNWETWTKDITDPKINENQDLWVTFYSPVSGNLLRKTFSKYWGYFERSIHKTIPCLKEPSTHREKKLAVRNHLIKMPNWSKTHPYPVFKRYGYNSLDEYMDGWTWSFKWNASTLELECDHKRYEYTIKQPILKPDKTLFANFFPKMKGDKEVHDLKENDDRFYAQVVADIPV